MTAVEDHTIKGEYKYLIIREDCRRETLVISYFRSLRPTGRATLAQFTTIYHLQVGSSAKTLGYTKGGPQTKTQR